MSGLALALQIFGTLFVILIGFLSMTAWIIRRIDRVTDMVIDQGNKLSRIEGKLEPSTAGSATP